MSRLSDAIAAKALAVALIFAGLILSGWDGLTWWLHPDIGFAEYFFRRQDAWILATYGLTLFGLGCWVLLARERTGPSRLGAPGAWLAIAAITMLIGARLGRDLVFHNYSPSRDELMVELASAYLAHGHLGWPIPPEWRPWQRAMMPEFYSPYGADTHWTAIYLPLHAAFRALFLRLGDAALAAPVMLGIGLLALWRTSVRLFPTRTDARVVTLVMALSSAQLLATAMTPYAMTSHFALNMVWLALVLREKWWSHALAGLVALVAAGLHQWHFPLLFIGPFIIWMVLRRRWRAALFHIVVAVAMMVVWAKLWPLALTHFVGPPPPSDIHRTNGVFDKLESLFGRLDSWQPLLNIARLFAWNNLLLAPLALLAPFAVRWRPVWERLLRDPPIVLPLAIGVLSGMGLALYQGYGWGFRYMHGQMGALCLLAGYGWTVVTRTAQRRGQAALVVGTAISLVACLWLLRDTERYVRGYARTMTAIRASGADVVLIDIRGGYYLTDLARFDEGRPGAQAIMPLHHLSFAQLDRLCAAHRVAIADRSLYWPLGLYPVSPHMRESKAIQLRRDYLKRIGCGAIITP